MKLSEKFARRESEERRLARLARKRIPKDRLETIRRMFGDGKPKPTKKATNRKDRAA